MRTQFFKAPTLRHSILWLLIALLVVFIAGLLLLSTLNLNYSQESLSELRRQQIRDSVYLGLARINARQNDLANYTLTLANLGETFHQLSVDRYEDNQDVLNKDLEDALKEHLSDFDGISGGGLWYRTGTMAAAGQSFMPYYGFQETSKQPMRLDTEARFRNYRKAPWYDKIFGDAEDIDLTESNRVFWSPVYFDMETEQAVLALASPMFSKNGQLLGMATTTWAADEIINLVSEVTVTDGSFAFLNDTDNRNLSSLSQGEDTKQKQRLIDAILDLELSNQLTPGSEEAAPSLRTAAFSVQDLDYELYYASTLAGMVYGAGVPKHEINAVLRPLETTNRRILFGTMAAMLIISAFLVYRIVTLIRELQASYTDELTGLANRARLLRDLKSRKGAATMILNLDRFNQINSLFGTDCGDHILMVAATRLAALMNNAEVSRIYRLPGDEFAILLEPGKGQSIDHLEQLAESTRMLVTDERAYWQGQPLTLDATIGVAFKHHYGKGDPDDLLVSQAKIAVSRAREEGRHHLIYDPTVGIEKAYENNLHWANRLKEAIESDRLKPWFQPIYDNRLKTIAKYECLVRIEEPDGQIITAGLFVDIANRLRLNRTITAVMVEQCFAMFQDREEEFSINLSYGDLTHGPTVDLILQALTETGVGNRVIFEILESDGITNYSDISQFIEKVRPFGCRIAIDDFGTGYSNFAHLLSLNVDFIKIDGSLIRHLHEDETAVLVAGGIVDFAQGLGIQTVAEFVHNAEVQVTVEKLGIHFSQGEYFGMARSKP